MKKILVIVICVVTLCTSSLTAFAETLYGAEAVDENRTYTLPEMLTMAIEDEYLAYARYENVIQKFGARLCYGSFNASLITIVILAGKRNECSV